jgi:anti-sigma-K factor RskA
VRALLAAAVVALLSLGAVALFTRSSAETFDFAMSSPNGGPAGGTANAHQTSHGWSIRLSLHGLPALNDKAFYECWYVDLAKDSPTRPFRVSAGTFDATDSGKADVQMWSSADPKQFPTMQITVEPVDGNPAPSQDVVLIGVARRH